MEELLISIARGLVEQPDEVRVDTDEPAEDGTIVYHLHVAENDMGRVIGKQGRMLRRSVWLCAPRLRKTTAGFLSKSTEPKRRTYMHTSFSFVSCNQISLHKIWDGKEGFRFRR